MESFLVQLPQQLVNGLTLGGVYALIALGYSMVFGVLKLLNFAHGDIYMVGAFIGFGVMSTFLDGSALAAPALIVLLLMFLAAMIGCGILGVGVERIAYRRLRRAPRIAALISALGMSFFIQNAVQLTLSADFRAYQTQVLLPPDAGFGVLGVHISAVRGLAIVMAIGLMFLLHGLVRRSRLGKAMRAVATDPEAATMLGIDVDKVIVFTFFVGSALAGAAGVITGLVFIRVWHFMGFLAGLKGFVAAVIGGIGNIPGAMLGGFVLGIVETFAIGFVSATFRDVIAFGVLLLVLLIKPQGLLGARIPDRA